MMRLAMITDYARPGESLDGGVRAVTSYLVEALAKRGDLEVHLVRFDYGTNQTTSTEHGCVHQHVLPGATGGVMTGFRKDQRTLNELLRKIRPDVVHGQGAGHDGIVAIRSGFPTVVTIHGIMAEEAKFRAGLANRLRHRLLNKWSEHLCIKNGQHTILISPYVAKYFTGSLAGQQHLIPNPVSDEFFQVEHKEVPGRLMFAGRLYGLKGVHDLIHAVASLRQTHECELMLAGSLHDRDYVDGLKANIARFELEDKVRFMGLLEPGEYRRALQETAVLVLPSYQETAPMVIAEAMAAGVPVVATNVGGVKYQIDDGETGFIVEPGDTSQLANRLSRLLGDPTLRHQFGEAARTKAELTFQCDAVAKKTVEVYRTALGNS